VALACLVELARRCSAPQPGLGQARERRARPLSVNRGRDPVRVGTRRCPPSGGLRPGTRHQPLSGGGCIPAGDRSLGTGGWCLATRWRVRASVGAERSSPSVRDPRITVERGAGVWSASAPVGREDLGGGQSPWKDRAPPAGNGRWALRTRRRSNASKSALWCSELRGSSLATEAVAGVEGIGGNGTGATATVTWCGCGRGEFFEGCDVRRGECPGTPDRSGLVPVSVGNPAAGNAANPMAGSGMQQARDLRAEEPVEVV
jgi:hypothetical protein